MKDKILDSMAYHGVVCRTKEDYEVFADDICREINKANEPIRKELRSSMACVKAHNGTNYCKNCGIEFDEMLKQLK